MLATQICFADSTAEKAEEVINADLANVDKWYEQNGMKRNTSIYQAIVMGNSQVKPQFYCENTAISITGELEMLGVAVDDKIQEAHSKCMQKSLPADRCTQANEKDPSI